jgi:hypothetical protein
MNPEKIGYKVVKTRKGLDTIIVSVKDKEIPLHSKINPDRECEMFMDAFVPEKYDLLIVLGLGLGYHLVPLSQYLDRYFQVIAIDILAGIDTAINTNPLTSFLVKSERISLVLGETPVRVNEILYGMIDMDAIKGISVLEHPASTRVFEDYYGKIREFVEKLINKKAGNKATQKAFGPLYLKNIIQNIPLLDEVRPVQDLFGTLRPYPAVIVAPGPCLEKDMAGIKTHRNRFFIVSVDSALRVLHVHDIKPDFIVSIDPQPYVYEHFLDTDAGHALGIASISSSPAVLKRLKGYLSLNSHPLSQVASRISIDPIGSIDSGTGSVAGDAVNLCLKCGFRSIGIAGLDFSFTGYKTYSRGTAYQRRYSFYFQNRFSTVEGYNCRYILFSSRGLKHGGKFTRNSFLRYKESLEGFISGREAAGLFSLNGCGIPLSGIQALSFDEFLDRNTGSEIDKMSVLASIRQGSGTLSSKELISGLNKILDGKLFDELLSASLGGNVDERTKGKYRKMIELIK